jgi:hypothetical protein
LSKYVVIGSHPDNVLEFRNLIKAVGDDLKLVLVNHQIYLFPLEGRVPVAVCSVHSDGLSSWLTKSAYTEGDKFDGEVIAGLDDPRKIVTYRTRPRGSSSQMAVDWCLQQGDCQAVYLCGVHLDDGPYACFRDTWLKAIQTECYLGRVFSMGGWTRSKLGGPSWDADNIR